MVVVLGGSFVAWVRGVCMLIELYWCLGIGVCLVMGGLASRTQSRGDENITKHAIHIWWASVRESILEELQHFRVIMSPGSNIRGGHEVL